MNIRITKKKVLAYLAYEVGAGYFLYRKYRFYTDQIAMFERDLEMAFEREDALLRALDEQDEEMEQAGDIVAPGLGYPEKLGYEPSFLDAVFGECDRPPRQMKLT